MKRIDFSLILACYNEEPLFVDSVEKIREVLDLSSFSYEILFVDDKSQDSTRKLIEKTCKKYKECKAIYHEVNKGRGRSVADGIKLARGTVVGYIDIDLEVSPVYIPQMVKMILDKHVDIVLGKRIYRTNIASIPREIFSNGYKYLAQVLLDTGGLDTETGYKFFRRSKILPIVRLAQHPHWFWDTEIMVLSKRLGLTIEEVPVLFLRRFDKTSSVKIFQDIQDYLVNILKLRKRLQELHLE